MKILDKFTEYVTELTAELTFRKKQYFFYRDKLLSFEDEVYQVEWKTLGDIGKVSMCKRILKHQTSENGGVPFYKIGTFGKAANSYISEELFEEYRNKYSYPNEGDILISASGTIGRTVIFDGKPSYFQDSNIVWLEHDGSQVLNKYLFYFYQTNPWRVADGGTINRLYNDSILKTKIPVPPLAIQERIVYVLDHFDTVCHDLNIGLPKEIELRQKQYEFFRDKLLTFAAEGVYTDSTVQYSNWVITLLQWVFGTIRVELGAVFNIVAGGDVPKNAMSDIKTEEYRFPILSNGIEDKAIYGWTNKPKISDPSLTISARGTIGWASYQENPFYPIVRLLVLTPRIEFNLKYAYYFMKSIENKYDIPQSGIPQLTKPMIKNKILPLPPLSDQARIVYILDRFNTLTSSLTQGLPREIELREKQYAYFRDKLLTFV